MNKKRVDLLEKLAAAIDEIDFIYLASGKVGASYLEGYQTELLAIADIAEKLERTKK